MRRMVIFALLGLTLCLPAHADFRTALDAYERGDRGAAFVEFGQLAERGDANSQYMLGYMHAVGDWALKDYVKAYKWFSLAAVAGQADALKVRDEIATKMTSNQIASAQALAQEWMANSSTASTRDQSRTEQSRPRFEPISADLMRRIQTRLLELGYDPGPADGAMGYRTKTAIERFQRDTNLPIDGRPSESLLAQLSWASPTPPAPVSRQVSRVDPQIDPRTVALLNALRDLPNQTKGNMDSRVQRRLESLIARYESPWWQNIVHDNFRDGDYTSSPQWTLTQGHFDVDPQLGLISRVTKEAPRQQRGDDLASLLNAVLGQVLDKKAGNRQASGSPAYSELYLEKPVSDAFRVRLRLSSGSAAGALEFALYQGSQRTQGYRLLLAPQNEQTLRLIRNAYGDSTIMAASRTRLPIDDGQFHILEWTRARDGSMAVSMDKQQYLIVPDSRLSGGFERMSLVSHGGEYVLRSVSVSGTGGTR